MLLNYFIDPPKTRDFNRIHLIFSRRKSEEKTRSSAITLLQVANSKSLYFTINLKSKFCDVLLDWINNKFGTGGILVKNNNRRMIFINSITSKHFSWKIQN